jgi:hypothetical protein
MYVAFEEGRDSRHVPACCTTYLKLDMAKWW